ncbi:MAG TPA: DinB family protein [Acidimicrobiales bacterium]|nr:DinB family protein [Acidimicrobiales bacterium]
MERTDPDTTGDELTLLSQFLDYHRATLVQKVSGLDRQQLGTRLGPSTLTLAGLVKHLALVEDSWFDKRLLGHEEREPWASVDWEADPDWEFRTAIDDEPEDLLALYADACERSRAAIAEVGDPDRLAATPSRRGEPLTLRWIMLHMIEETARHNGHADLLRENIDGVTGE